MRYRILFMLVLLHLSILTNAQLDCDNSTVGFIPLNDLGTGEFMDYEGGLYPDGSNEMPLSHLIKGTIIGNGIRPLDTAGKVDWTNGIILMAGFGASTAGSTFNTLKSTFNNADSVNGCLELIPLTFGGKGLESMVPGGSFTYWNLLEDSILAPTGFSPEQVQIGWIKSASKDDSINEFPLQADSIYSKYIRAVQRMKVVFPNLKILYVTSHAYGGYAGELSDNVKLVGEPAAYYGGFSVKWLIESQINGDPRLRFEGGNPPAPWLAWAPYYWADGIQPRSDGLTWECSDYEEDGGGFHHSESGKIKETDMLFDFLYNQESAATWFRSTYACDYSPVNIAEQNSSSVQLYPSPNNGSFLLKGLQPQETAIRIYGMDGTLVRRYNYAAADIAESMQLVTQLPPGMYVLQAIAGAQVSDQLFIVR
jgi:hypothetical protein